jgi:IrrE N-terminal-like domain
MAQLSLLDQARLADPTGSDAARIERIAADTIAELDERPPVDLEVVASYRGIGDIHIQPLPFAGSLTPEPDGLVMRLRAEDAPRRRRFTGFHEVGHTFQPGYQETQSLRCPSPRPRTAHADDPEALSDLAAAELLLPSAYFAADLATTPFGVDGVLELADTYEASVAATGLRLVRFWPEPTLLLTLEPGVRKAERHDPAATAKLRVRSSACSGPWPFVPRNKSAAVGGPLHRALLGEVIEEYTTLADLGVDGGPAVQLSARVFPYRDQDGRSCDRVVALYRRPQEVRRGRP